MVATVTELRNTCALTGVSVKPGENALGGKGVSSNWVNYNLNKNKVRIVFYKKSTN